MRKKVLFIGIAIVLLSSIMLIWYKSPTNFAKDIDADDIEYFSIFDGQTGTGFQVDDPVYISMIVRNLQNIAVRKNGISLGAMGYGFKIEGVDKNGKTIIPVFMMNSETTLRKDPFFYTCDGGLCFDFLKELEPNITIESSLPEDSLAINIDGVTYFGLGEPIPVEPDESVIEYVEMPAGDGETTITAFARIDEGRMIVCLVNGEWYKFHSMEALASSEIHLENEDEMLCEHAEDEIPRLIMVNNELYYDCAEESTVSGRCGMMDGMIDAVTDNENGIPTQNNTSNFGIGYGYQYGPNEGTIEVNIDDGWCVFRKYKKGLIEHLDNILDEMDKGNR